MSFNIEKCQTICLSTKKNVGPYILNGHTLDGDHQHSYLGLKWAGHVAPVFSSAKQILALSGGILDIQSLPGNSNPL